MNLPYLESVRKSNVFRKSKITLNNYKSTEENLKKENMLKNYKKYMQNQGLIPTPPTNNNINQIKRSNSKGTSNYDSENNVNLLQLKSKYFYWKFFSQCSKGKK